MACWVGTHLACFFLFINVQRLSRPSWLSIVGIRPWGEERAANWRWFRVPRWTMTRRGWKNSWRRQWAGRPSWTTEYTTCTCSLSRAQVEERRRSRQRPRSGSTHSGCNTRTRKRRRRTWSGGCLGLRIICHGTRRRCRPSLCPCPWATSPSRPTGGRSLKSCKRRTSWVWRSSFCSTSRLTRWGITIHS